MLLGITKVMAKAKTEEFFLMKTLQFPTTTASGTSVSGTIDLSTYINPVQNLAIAVTEVTALWQRGSLYAADVQSMVVGDAALQWQVSDANPSLTMLRGDNLNLIGDGAINIAQASNQATAVASMFPDHYGGESQSRYVVNDTLYCVAAVEGHTTSTTDIVYCTLRVRVKSVKLDSKAWQTIALQQIAQN